jgi:Cu2+-containing amine oxidase
MTPWQEYKKKLGTTRPWDIVNPNKEHASDEEANLRLATCEVCPSLLKLTHQCKECGCFMKIKVKLKDAECPLGKW